MEPEELTEEKFGSTVGIGYDRLHGSAGMKRFGVGMRPLRPRPNPNPAIIPWITSYPLDNKVQGAAVAQEFLGIIPRGEIQGLQQLPPHLI